MTNAEYRCTTEYRWINRTVQFIHPRTGQETHGIVDRTRGDILVIVPSGCRRFASVEVPASDVTIYRNPAIMDCR